MENTFRTIRRATSEDSDHLPMQGQSVVANRHVNSSSWRNYKSLVKYISFSEGLNAFCGV